MNIKKRIIFGRIVVFAIGFALMLSGFIKDNTNLINIGVAMLAVGVVQLIKQWKYLKNPEKLQELKNSYNDERILFIARKSYTFSFWTSVYAEFIAVVTLLISGNNEVAKVVGMILCFQVFVYAFANLYYSKRY